MGKILVTEMQMKEFHRGNNAYLTLGAYRQKKSCHFSVVLVVLTTFLSLLSAKCAERVSKVTENLMSLKVG